MAEPTYTFTKKSVDLIAKTVKTVERLDKRILRLEQQGGSRSQYARTLVAVVTMTVGRFGAGRAKLRRLLDTGSWQDTDEEVRVVDGGFIPSSGGALTPGRRIIITQMYGSWVVTGYDCEPSSPNA